MSNDIYSLNFDSLQLELTRIRVPCSVTTDPPFILLRRLFVPTQPFSLVVSDRVGMHEVPMHQHQAHHQPRDLSSYCDCSFQFSLSRLSSLTELACIMKWQKQIILALAFLLYCCCSLLQRLNPRLQPCSNLSLERRHIRSKCRFLLLQHNRLLHSITAGVVSAASATIQQT